MTGRIGQAADEPAPPFAERASPGLEPPESPATSYSADSPGGNSGARHADPLYSGSGYDLRASRRHTGRAILFAALIGCFLFAGLWWMVGLMIVAAIASEFRSSIGRMRVRVVVDDDGVTVTRRGRSRRWRRESMTSVSVDLCRAEEGLAAVRDFRRRQGREAGKPADVRVVRLRAKVAGSTAAEQRFLYGRHMGDHDLDILLVLPLDACDRLATGLARWPQAQVGDVS